MVCAIFSQNIIPFTTTSGICQSLYRFFRAPHFSSLGFTQPPVGDCAPPPLYKAPLCMSVPSLMCLTPQARHLVAQPFRGALAPQLVTQKIPFSRQVWSVSWCGCCGFLCVQHFSSIIFPHLGLFSYLAHSIKNVLTWQTTIWQGWHGTTELKLLGHTSSKFNPDQFKIQFWLFKVQFNKVQFFSPQQKSQTLYEWALEEKLSGGVNKLWDVTSGSISRLGHYQV